MNLETTQLLREMSMAELIGVRDYLKDNPGCDELARHAREAVQNEIGIRRESHYGRKGRKATHGNVVQAIVDELVATAKELAEQDGQAQIASAFNALAQRLVERQSAAVVTLSKSETASCNGRLFAPKTDVD